MHPLDLPPQFIEPARCAADAARIRIAKTWASTLLPRLIAARGLTQKAAAALAQTSQTRISNIKNGVLHATRLELILRILERLGATVTVVANPAGIQVAWTAGETRMVEHFRF